MGELVGVVLGWNMRDGTKTIRPLAKHAARWHIGPMPVPRPLYRLPEIAAAARGQPIDSGVTEAACKVLIQERFCRSGSRGKEEGAAVLAIRALKLTPGSLGGFLEPHLPLWVYESGHIDIDIILYDTSSNLRQAVRKLPRPFRDLLLDYLCQTA